MSEVFYQGPRRYLKVWAKSENKKVPNYNSLNFMETVDFDFRFVKNNLQQNFIRDFT